VNGVKAMENEWLKMGNYIDKERFDKVKSLLALQEDHAKLWRDGCLLYFQTFSKRPIPEQYAKPEHDLQYYMNYRYTNVPGIR
jgi:alpha-glucuronidase